MAPMIIGLLRGDRIRLLREASHLGQETLSGMVGVSQSLLSQWENGVGRRPSADKVLRLASVLSTTTEYLLGRTDDSRPRVDPPVC